MVGPCGSGKYAGERCLIPGNDKKEGKYPVTENGKISMGRLRNVAVRASQFGHVAEVKAGGFCNIAKRAGLDSSICGGDSDGK